MVPFRGTSKSFFLGGGYHFHGFLEALYPNAVFSSPEPCFHSLHLAPTGQCSRLYPEYLRPVAQGERRINTYLHVNIQLKKVHIHHIHSCRYRPLKSIHIYMYISRSMCIYVYIQLHMHTCWQNKTDI